MATTSPTTAAGTIAVALDKMYVPANVRELDPEHVDALAGSIALQGQLVPVLVVPARVVAAERGFEYELVAGFHRYAAVAKLQHSAIDVIVLDGEEVPDGGIEIAAARATENIARKQLNPYEEAIAVQAMLDRGLTDDGAAQALGWPKARVTARAKLLELPAAAQRLVGQGVLPLSSVDMLRSVGRASPDILDAVVEYVGDGDDWVVDQLQTNLGLVIGRALRETDSDAFATYLHQVDGRDIANLRLGKKAGEQLSEIEQLHKRINQYSYGPPPIRFNEQDVDQARAAGALIESASSPVIVDRTLYCELAKQAIKRTVEELREQATTLAQQHQADKAAGRERQAADPVAQLRREHGRLMRQFAAQAHGVNLDLGWALRNELATVDPGDINVARFFVYALLGCDYHDGYGNAGEKVVELAMTGIRLVVDEFRTDVTNTKTDESRGALRISYGDPHKPADAVAWMWKCVDGARTAGELYGRALVVIAAQQYASRLVLPSSQQHAAVRWSSHKDHAAKALAKLAAPCLPTSLKQLEKAIAKAKTDDDRQVNAAETASRAEFNTDHDQRDEPVDESVEHEPHFDEDEPGAV